MAAADLRATKTETSATSGPHDETNCCLGGLVNCFAFDYHCLRDVNVWQPSFLDD